jgi:hypothetical protein
MFKMIVEEVELNGGVLMPNGRRLKPLADGEQRRKNKPRTKASEPVEQSDIEAIAPLVESGIVKIAEQPTAAIESEPTITANPHEDKAEQPTVAIKRKRYNEVKPTAARVEFRLDKDSLRWLESLNGSIADNLRRLVHEARALADKVEVSL